MGGEHDSYFQARLPQTLKQRFKRSCKVGGAGKVSQADAIRVLMELRCAFTEKMNRQPASLEELCAWFLEESAKPKPD